MPLKYALLTFCAVMLCANTALGAIHVTVAGFPKEHFCMGDSLPSTLPLPIWLPSWLDIHFQLTSVTQGHPGFFAPYTGQNSLRPEAETAMSLTTTLFATAHLWHGGEVIFHPEIAGGEGMSGAAGLAGYPNGETFRVGQAKPVLYVARAYFRQRFDFSGVPDTSSSVLALSVRRPSELFRRAGATSRLMIVAGKFSAADFFDESSYSHDLRTQFLNWSLMSAGAWDYAADTRGYTWGAAAEYTYNEWSFGAIFCLVPLTANGLELDTRIGEAHGTGLQVEFNYALGEQKGVARAMVFRNIANAGTYRQALLQMPRNPDIEQTRRYGTQKYGFIVSLEQEVSDNIGFFARASWNDGATETWAFTEIDHSLCAGVQFSGGLWQRPYDALGIASVVNGISDDHRAYLAAGGYGFIIGDGALSYAPEWISEIYYRFQVNDWLHLTADYQLVLNPAYNQARGPVVHIGALRAHIEF